MNVFFRRGAPLPIFQALRCCGGAALLQRKEWRAAKARISLVVRRRCCPSSALELEQRRAANACEAGPRRLAMSPHFGWGAPMIFMGGCGRRVNHVPRRARGPRHTQSFVSQAKDCRHYSIGVFSARGCCLTRWRLQGMFTPCQRASWAAEPTLLRSFSYEYLARTCCGRGYPDTTQRALFLGRVTKEEGPFSRWPPFSLEPHGPRDLF